MCAGVCVCVCVCVCVRACVRVKITNIKLYLFCNGDFYLWL